MPLFLVQYLSHWTWQRIFKWGNMQNANSTQDKEQNSLIYGTHNEPLVGPLLLLNVTVLLALCVMNISCFVLDLAH